MKAFIDTSSLAKKYLDEEGIEEFDAVLEKISEIIISPITWLETNYVLERKIKEKIISFNEGFWLKDEINKDFQSFKQIQWNKTLETRAIEMIQKYQLRSLDSIQLASAILSDCDVFVTSDKRLSFYACGEFKNVKLI